MEVSVIAARNTKGEIATFPLVENIHEENILRMTIAPARVSAEISKKGKSSSSTNYASTKRRRCFWNRDVCN